MAEVALALRVLGLGLGFRDYKLFCWPSAGFNHRSSKQPKANIESKLHGGHVSGIKARHYRPTPATPHYGPNNALLHVVRSSCEHAWGGIELNDLEAP